MLVNESSRYRVNESRRQTSVSGQLMLVTREQQKENLRNSMRIDLEVLSSFDLIITTRTSGSECMSVNSKFESSRERE